ncbi:MAG: hypothetical protein GYB31_12835 [Bacteroidetes bacterium]|nr:hypothetical protein [Bacteroidota bacterium]
MKTLLFLACLALITFSCHSPEGKTDTPETNEVNLDSLLPGTWENISLEVVVNSFNNTDSSYSILVPRGEWEAKLGIKPIRTTYETNNTYRSEYRDLKDSLVQTTRGIWNVFGDTLMLIESDATYEYLVRARKSAVEFTAILDWDGDGREDDLYKGIQAKAED